jgi:hypothetical protein
MTDTATTPLDGAQRPTLPRAIATWSGSRMPHTAVKTIVRMNSDVNLIHEDAGEGHF